MKEKGSYSRRSSCGRRRHRLPPLTLCICRVRWVRTLVEGFLTPCGARKDRPKLDSPNWDGLSADRGLAVFFPVSTAIIMCNNFNKYSTRNERTTNERTNERYIIALLTLHHTTTCVYVGTSWPLNWLRFFFLSSSSSRAFVRAGKERKKERKRETHKQINRKRKNRKLTHCNTCPERKNGSTNERICPPGRRAKFHSDGTTGRPVRIVCPPTGVNKCSRGWWTFAFHLPPPEARACRLSPALVLPVDSHRRQTRKPLPFLLLLLLLLQLPMRLYFFLKKKPKEKHFSSS